MNDTIQLEAVDQINQKPVQEQTAQQMASPQDDNSEISVVAPQHTAGDVTVATATPPQEEIQPSTEGTGNEMNNAAAVPTPQMTPAPAPPAEPDMSKLPLADPMPAHQNKHCAHAIKAVKRLRDARPFLAPVDIVALNIPYYFNYIERPMDIGTIERKLDLNAYHSADEVISDFSLMVANCCLFNGDKSAIAQMARNVQAAFEKHMLGLPAREIPSSMETSAPSSKGKARSKSATEEGLTIRQGPHRPKRAIHPPRKDIPYTPSLSKKNARELRFCNQVAKELVSKKYSSFNFPFLEPVDPVGMGLPTYFDFVKEPMDLGTITKKLNNSEYQNADEFEKDVRLVISNCYIFNPEGTTVNMMGKRLEELFEEKWKGRPEDEDDEEEWEYVTDSASEDESSITTPAIQLLEEQVARMQVEIQKLKKLELKTRQSKKKKKRVKRRKVKSTSGDEAASVVTFSMMREISEGINFLPADQLAEASAMIAKSMNVDSVEELELDIDTLPSDVIIAIYNKFFKKASAPVVSKPAALVKPSTKKRKRTTKEEEDQQIDEIKRKLALLDHANTPTSVMGDLDSSDDDDDDSSESEEE